MSFVPEVRCAIYERISRDRMGDQLGIERQRHDCEKLATSRGWSVIGHYVDNDVSAYEDRERAAWDRLVGDLGAGRVDAIVAWHPDRMYRKMRDLEDLVDLVESRRVSMATVQTGDVDLSTTQGRLVARLAGAVAAHESEHKSERIARKHLELAERGRWKGGRRNYGYRPVGEGQLAIVPEEAKVIREAAERALAGEAIHSICRDLTSRGIPTLRGGDWRPTSLRRILTAPAVCGQREYHGKVVGRAGWDPILDELTVARLRSLSGPPRRAAARVSWLGGLLRCGHCGRPLRSMRRESGARVYACPPGAGNGGCGRIQAQAVPVEAVIAEAIFVAIDRPELAARAAERRSARQRSGEDIGELEEQLAELAAGWAAGSISTTEWRAARPVLLKRVEQARSALLNHETDQALARYDDAGALRNAWDGLSLDQRRMIAGALIESVIVLPANRRGRNFDPSRLQVNWSR